MNDPDEAIERLQSVASERWGDRWTVEVSYFADGDFQATALQSRGRTEEGFLEHERLFVSDDGTVAAERAVVERREIENEYLGVVDD